MNKCKIIYSILFILLLTSITQTQAATTEYNYGTATAFTYYSTNTPIKAFDNNPSTWWVGYPLSFPAWLMMDYGAGVNHTINNYTMNGWTNGAYYPTGWSFLGSIDNITWTYLDNRTGQTFVSGETKVFTFTNSNQYRYYKFNITTTYNAAEVDILEIHFYYEYTPTPTPTLSPYNLTYNLTNAAQDMAYYNNVTNNSNVAGVIVFVNKLEIVIILLTIITLCLLFIVIYIIYKEAYR